MSQIELPKMGFGTWHLDLKTCKFAVEKAIEIGYRFIDTAQEYKNEEAVGEAIATSGLRDNIILGTKVAIPNLSPEKVHTGTEKSLAKLRTDYVDILYVHFPIYPYRDQQDPANDGSPRGWREGALHRCVELYT